LTTHEELTVSAQEASLGTPISEQVRARLLAASPGETIRWLTSSPPDLVALYRLGWAGDVLVLAALRNQSGLRDSLRHQAEISSKEGLTPEVLDWTIEALLQGTRFNTDDSKWLVDVLACHSETRQRQALTQVVDALRPKIYGSSGCPAQPGNHIGWLYVLVTLGKALFRAGLPLPALEHFEEAWTVRHLLPDNSRSAIAIATVAGQYENALCHLSAQDREGICFETLKQLAFARLLEARNLLVASTDRQSTFALVRNAISINELLAYAPAEQPLPSAETLLARRKGFDDTWNVCRGRLFARDSDLIDFDPTTFDEGEAAALARFFKDAALVAQLLAEDNAMELAQYAQAMSRGTYLGLTARLTAARVERDRTMQIRRYEQVLLEIRRLPQSGLSSRQRESLERQGALAASELAGVFARDNRIVSSWFWKHESKEWTRPRMGQALGPTDPSDQTPLDDTGSEEPFSDTTQVVRSPEFMPDPAVSPRDAADRLFLTEIQRHVTTGHGVGIVMSLMYFANRSRDGGDPPSKDAVAGVCAAASWEAPRRVGRRVPCAQDSESNASLALFAARLAEDYVKGYCPARRAEVLLYLARANQLTDAERSNHAQTAYRVAGTHSRWLEAASACLLRMKLDRNAAPVAASDLVSVMQQAVACALGTADLLDIVYWLYHLTDEAVAGLAAQELPVEAFNVAVGPLGIVRGVCSQDPSLLEEFELVEIWHAGRTTEVDERLVSLMRQRLERSAVVSLPEPRNLVELADECAPGRPVVFLQYYAGNKSGLRALGATVEDGVVKHWERALPLDPDRLPRLQHAVWAQLAPRRAGRPVPTLETLHKIFVAPLLDRLPTEAVLMLIPHHSLAGLPLHAAQGPAGPLIGTRDVGYLSSIVEQTPKQVPATALVCGWDPDIKAKQEQQRVTEILRQSGFVVCNPRDARKGREELLNADSRWGVLHIAAHGDFMPWPTSLQSRLRLSPSVEVRAAEWLVSACSARFAFVNACSVGHPALRAGDLNGFPLAMHTRGVVTMVAALVPVVADGAAQFVDHFYEGWRGQGRTSLDAYARACRAAVDAGASPCRWVPYVHAGLPLSASEGQAKSVTKLKPVRRKARRR
jgi:CHAT domain